MINTTNYRPSMFLDKLSFPKTSNNRRLQHSTLETVNRGEKLMVITNNKDLESYTVGVGI